MSGPGPDVLVLRRGAHGMSTETYAEALRERLPEHEVIRARTPAEERELVARATVATGHGIDEGLVERAEELRLFACAAAGYDHLPLDALEERDVAVTNASGVHGPNIAEQVIGSILLFSRNLHEGIRRGERGEWRHYQAHHTELGDSTVTVVGLGAIGQAIVERLRPFGPRILGVRYTPEKGGPTDEVFGFEADSFHEALAGTDYLVLACPLTEETRGLVDGAALDTLSPESVVVNVGRGSVVETDALLDSLQDNSVRGAALDVTDPEPLPADHELWRMGNVVVTPHNSGHTSQYYSRLAEILAGNVERLEETGTFEGIENRVR